MTHTYRLIGTTVCAINYVPGATSPPHLDRPKEVSFVVGYRAEIRSGSRELMVGDVTHVGDEKSAAMKFTTAV